MAICRAAADGRQAGRQWIAGAAGVGGKAVAGWIGQVGKLNSAPPPRPIMFPREGGGTRKRRVSLVTSTTPASAGVVWIGRARA